MDIIKKRWFYLALAVIILLFMGIAYAFSLFVVPIENDLGFTRAETSLTFTLCFIFFSLGSLITGFLIQKISPSILMKLGAILIGFGFYASTIVTEPWQLYFTYSVCCGFAIGLSYNVGVSILPLYFHDKLGLATGILLMGFAMSTTIFGPICEIGLSSIGWKSVFCILAVCTFIILFLGSFIIRQPSDEQEKHLPKVSEKKTSVQEYKPMEVLKSKIYYIFVMIYILIGGVGISLINHAAPTLQEDLNVSTTSTALIVSFVCLFNGIGRVLWGVIYDKLGASLVLKTLGILSILSMMIILFSLNTNSIVAFAIGCSIALLCYGGSSSLAPIIVRALFGDKYFSMNFAITNVGTMLLSCVPTLVGFLQTINGNYTLPYILLLFFAVLSFVLAVIYSLYIKRHTVYKQ